MAASTGSRDAKIGLYAGLSKNPNLTGEQVDRWLDIVYGEPKPPGGGTFEMWSNPALARATRLDHRNVGLLSRNPNAPNAQVRAAAEQLVAGWDSQLSYEDNRRKTSYGALINHASWGEIPRDLLIASFVPAKAATSLFATMTDRSKPLDERVLALELLLGWARETIQESNHLVPWLPLETPQDLLEPFLKSPRRSRETWNEGEERPQPGPTVYMEHYFGIPPRWPSERQRLLAVYRSPSTPESLRRDVMAKLRAMPDDPPEWLKHAFFPERPY